MMAKNTPAPDMNEPAPEAPLADGMISDDKMDATITVPDAVAGLPPAEPSVGTAPDGTLVVTKTEVESSNATISVAEPDPVREQLGEDLAKDLAVPPNAAGTPFFGTLALPAASGVIDMATVYAENTEKAIHEANRILDENRPDAKEATLFPTDGSAPIPLRTVSDLTSEIGSDVAALGDEAKAGLDDFLIAFERKVSERDGVRKIIAAGEHAIAAVGQWPTRIEHAIALPLADELDTLHEVEGLVIASFMDVGDVVRKVYLNVLGHFVKA
jgi:hypothetical protein